MLNANQIIHKIRKDENQTYVITYQTEKETIARVFGFCCFLHPVKVVANTLPTKTEVNAAFLNSFFKKLTPFLI